MKCKISQLFFAILTMGVGSVAHAQTDAERKIIVRDYDFAKIAQLEKEFNQRYNEEFEKAVAYAKEHNLPVQGINERGQVFALYGFVPGTKELAYHITSNNGPIGSVRTARANHLKEGGDLGLNLEGQGMTIGIWDGGQPRATHQSLGVDRVINKDQSSGIGDHATHVAGTMASSGVVANTKGFAPQSTLWANSFYVGNDFAKMINQAGQGLLVSNHSYGLDYINAGIENNSLPLGQYNQQARDVDQLLHAAPNYTAVWAAGNSRNGDWNGSRTVKYNQGKLGNDMLYGSSLAKNVVVVAAVKGIGEYNSADDVVMSDFSNWGPTDDFRIKPDISAKGVDVFSLEAENDSKTGYMDGTSMAAPAVTGVFALWQQYFKQLWPTKVNMKSATVRALMAATADEAGKYKTTSGSVITSGQGPDHRFGWGLINARKGAEVLKAVKGANGVSSAVLQEATLANGQTYELKFTVAPGNDQPLIATIAWNDPAGSVKTGEDNSTPALVNDLDLRIIRPNGEEILPWKLNKSFTDLYTLRGDNDVDNIEKVEYVGAASGVAGPGEYTIRVKHKGNLVGDAQDFSLIVYSGMGGSASDKDFTFEGVDVYPNPTSDVVYITDNKGDLVGGEAKVFDMQGKMLDVVHSIAKDTKLDFSRYAKGVYFIQLSHQSKKQTIKMVKK